MSSNRPDNPTFLRGAAASRRWYDGRAIAVEARLFAIAGLCLVALAGCVVNPVPTPTDNSGGLATGGKDNEGRFSGDTSAASDTALSDTTGAGGGADVGMSDSSASMDVAEVPGDATPTNDATDDATVDASVDATDDADEDSHAD